MLLHVFVYINPEQIENYDKNKIKLKSIEKKNKKSNNKVTITTMNLVKK